MNEAQPIPIVAKAEAEPALSCGVSLLRELRPLARKAYEKTGEYKLLRMEICRRACALALDPRAKMEAARKHEAARAQSGYRGGRPPSVHGLFFRDLSAATGICRETLKNWLAEWNEFAEALGVPLDEVEKVRILDNPLDEIFRGFVTTCPKTPSPSVTEWIEHVLSQSAHKPEPRVPPTPERVAEKFIEKVEGFFSHKQAAVLRTQAHKDAFARRCNDLFRRNGLEWELIPHERRG